MNRLAHSICRASLTCMAKKEEKDGDDDVDDDGDGMRGSNLLVLSYYEVITAVCAMAVCMCVALQQSSHHPAATIITGFRDPM